MNVYLHKHVQQLSSVFRIKYTLVRKSPTTALPMNEMRRNDDQPELLQLVQQ
jgi:hypothetical protein